MFPPIEYRKGSLHDLTDLSFEGGLSVSAGSIEFNVLAMGHEFWIAKEGKKILGVAVFSEEAPGNLRILRVEVTPLRKNQGIGTRILRTAIEAHPQSEFSVTPSGQTEQFYSHLGFIHSGRWEMKLSTKPTTLTG